MPQLIGFDINILLKEQNQSHGIKQKFVNVRKKNVMTLLIESRNCRHMAKIIIFS